MAPDGPTATGEPTTPATSTAPEQGKDSSQAAPESEQGLLIQVDDQDGAGPSPSAPKTPPATTSSFQDHLEPSSYVDPTPPTPTASRPPSRTPSNAASRTNDDGSDTGSAGGAPGDDVETDKTHNVTDDTSEIQSIMDQFSESGAGPGAEEVMSPRLEIASPRLSNPPLQSPSTSQPLQQLQMQHPPRKSSLEPLSTAAAAAAAAASSSSPIVDQMQSLNLTVDAPVPTQQLDEKKGLPVDDEGQAPPPVPPKDDDAGPSSASSMSRPRLDRSPTSSSTTPASPTLHRRPPPDPEPEPALPFDFHRFLEQLRNKKADPVARYLKSFLQEFGKKQWMVHEQVKIISDFLAFIANKMALCEVWAEVPDAEFDNAREGMEKLVMNRLYSQTFSPAIPAPKPIPGAKPKRRGGDPPLGPGRRGQHQEDIERDDILTQKINIYGWVREEHLDIPQIGDSGRRFLKLAQQGEHIDALQKQKHMANLST